MRPSVSDAVLNTVDASVGAVVKMGKIVITIAEDTFLAVMGYANASAAINIAAPSIAPNIVVIAITGAA